jgi:hypothetical protein
VSLHAPHLVSVLEVSEDADAGGEEQERITRGDGAERGGVVLHVHQDGDLDLIREPEALGRGIAFLKDVRDRAIEQADAKER